MHALAFLHLTVLLLGGLLQTPSPKKQRGVLSLQEIAMRPDRAEGSIMALSHFDNYIRANYKDLVETDLLRTWDRNASRVVLVRRYASMSDLASTRERMTAD